LFGGVAAATPARLLHVRTWDIHTDDPHRHFGVAMRVSTGTSILRLGALGAAIAVALLVSGCDHVTSHHGGATAPVPPGSVPTQRLGRAAKPPVYLHYYLWWTPQHWRDRLGPSYPMTAAPLPLPGTLGADGCHASVHYPGARIVDVPSEGLYNQNDPATFDHHIAVAAAAGVTGFAVAWQGTGIPTQTPASSPYDTRLDLLVHRVDAYDATHAVPFRLALDMSAFGNYHRSSAALIADLTYFAGRYGADPAFANDFSSRPLTMLLDSRKYTGTQVVDVARAVGGRLFLISDDTNATWPREQRSFSGAGWYWSSQNPYANPRSATQVLSLAAQAHAAHKPWFAPFAPGFDDSLNGHPSCTPRNGVATLDRIWSINRQSRPDAWFGISWNEFVENTYLEPSRGAGSTELDELRRLIAAQ
jgi:hypothetical protein